jgi:tetratricopeptide (TPR) repeat protein
VKVRSVLDGNRSSYRLLDQVRIFPNRPDIRWDYRIHEQILPAVNRAGGGVRWTDVIIDHVGYQDAAMRRQKLERNLRLLQLDEADRPDDSFTLFNLGWTLLDLGQAVQARPRLQRSLEQAAPNSSILRKLYHLLTLVHRQVGEPEEALRLCREGLERFPDDAELLLEEGLLLRDRQDWLAAEQSWVRLLSAQKGDYFASEEAGLRGYKTRQLLAEVYLQQERLADAEMRWRAAVAERAEFEPSWMGLAEVFLRQSRWGELAELLEKLEGQGAAAAKVGWLRARGQLQRKEFSAAQRTLAAVIAQDRDAIGPRVLLSHVLLHEGRDWQAAEKALRDVLALDPQNKEAQHNLHILLGDRGRVGPAELIATAG